MGGKFQERECQAAHLDTSKRDTLRSRRDSKNQKSPEEGEPDYSLTALIYA
jgi:hypothetical protein